MITAADLAPVPQFRDIPDDDLQWLAEQFEELTYQDGDVVFAYGASADHMMVVFSGEMRVMRHVQGQWRFFAEIGPGLITGMLPYSRMKVYEAKGDAFGDLRVSMMHKDQFP